ncbi:SAV_915 family protein [Streptomyces flavofungini]|uniref:SAV_915 family protein n=1 Tax=Streptomyces flavofungini TaxID=68200 RepID=UPI0019AC3AAF|nr:hypothetical protein GCM10010349_14980 [Streptomyces flavofungini]
MTQQLVCGEDPEPCERGPAGPLFVPVRPGPAGCVARLFRTPVGDRTAVAFTTPQRLTDELGARQPWIRLSEPALRALTEPLGVPRVTVDPRLTPGSATPGRTSATTGRTSATTGRTSAALGRTSATAGRTSAATGRTFAATGHTSAATGRTPGSPAPRRTPASSAPRLTPAAPRPVAASADSAPRTSRWRDCDPQAVGALRVTGAAALVGALTAWIG